MAMTPMIGGTTVAQRNVCPNQRENGSWIICAQCHRMFKGSGCFENHQRVGVSGGMSVRQTYTKREECCQVVDLSQRSKGEHKCGEVRCPTCRKYDNPETYRRFLEPPKKNRERRERRDRRVRTRKKKKSTKRTFCSLILSTCRKRVFTLSTSW